MRILLLVIALAGCPRSRPDVTSSSTSPAATAVGCEALDQAACEQADDCHPELTIAPGCTGASCMTFARCQDADTVSCTKPASACDEPDPRCADHGDFRVKWVGGCHEGCVLAADCAPS